MFGGHNKHAKLYPQPRETGLEVVIESLVMLQLEASYERLFGLCLWFE